MAIATKKKKDSPERLNGDKYFNLIKHAADGIAIIQDGVFKMVNTALVRISGYGKKELLGMPFTELLTPQSQKLTLARYQARLAGKKVPPVYEIQAVTKDKKIRDIEINAALTEYNGRAADEVIIRDITERKQAEEALQAGKNKLQSLIDAMEDGLNIMDKDFNIIYQNGPIKEFYGDRLGEKCYRVYEGIDKICVSCPVKKAFKDGKSHTSERRIIDPSGEVAYWENTASPIRDAKGEIVSCLEVTRNITERKQAEQALADEATRRRILVDQSRDGIVILDQDGKVYEANQRFAEMLGYTPEEAAELHVRDWEYLYPREQVLEMIRTVDETGDHFETKHRRKDGSVFDVEISTNGTVIAGQKLIFCVCRDITERKKAEEKLQSILKTALDGFWMINLKGKLLEVNDSYCKMVGYTREELLKMSISDLEAAENPEEVAQHIAKIIEQGHASFESRHRRKDGKIIDVEISANYLGGDEGQFFIFARDITDRKQAEGQLQEKNEQLDTQNEELRTINEELQATEEELQHSQERLERMFESVTDGIVVATLGGTILKVNQRAVQIHGFASEDEMLGRSAFDLVAPRDHERIGADIRKALKEGLIGGGEYTLLRVDGTEFPGELSTSVLKDGRGNVIGHISISRDITERKQMEKLFKTVTNSSQVGIYIVKGRKFQMANPQFQKLTGFTEDELTGMDSLALVLDEDRAKVREEAIKMLNGERSSPYQFRVLNKAGETRWVMETVTSIPYRGGRAILGNYMDITERRQAEEREKQLEQELNLAGRLASIGQLAAGVAHEINNPLTGVIGFSHLMLNRDIPDDMKQDLQVIHSEAQRVAKIVENLLVFAHQRKPGREYANINEIINRVLELRAYEMKVNNIDVENRLSPDLPSTMADAGQLQQVFLNIILNAEHFITKAHNKGKLLVKTERIGSNIRASFTDNGAGISKENLDKIFNPFFTTKDVGDGTGLGLSICHGIITQHNGRIYAESELGKGATFVIEIPMVAKPAQPGKAEEIKKEPRKPRGAKILVVDDEVAILVFLKRLLTEWGHSVETINNANKALERLKTERYSLILLDIKLPGMSGIELYHHIEETVPALTRRVIFITGDIMQGATHSFLEKTGVPHITKPIDIEVLKKMINRALNQTKAAPVASG